MGNDESEILKVTINRYAQKITIIIFLLLLIITTEVHAEKLTCKELGVEGLCIDIEFVSVEDDYKTLSEYQFPDLVKINDYLVISKITVINKPGIVEESKNTSNVTLKIDAYPFRLERKDIERFEPIRSSTIYIPPLKTNDIYELTYLNEIGYYESKLNNQVINKKGRFEIYPKKLFTDGDWIIERGIEEHIGYSTLINGEWRNYFFKVYSNTEITNLKIAERNLGISELSVGIVVIVGLSTILIQYILARKQERVLENILEKLHEELPGPEEFKTWSEKKF